MNVDENTVIVAHGRMREYAFDHAFGTERIQSFDVSECRVITWIAGIDYDVTDCLPQALVDRWCEQLIELKAPCGAEEYANE